MRKISVAEFVAGAFILSTAAILARGEDAGSPHDIGYRFETGRIVRYRSILSRERRWEEPFRMTERGIEADDIRIEVLETSGDRARLTVTIERVRRSRKIDVDAAEGSPPPGMTSFEFDSGAWDESDPAARARAREEALAQKPELADAIRSVGATHGLEVDRRGKVSAVLGLEEAVAEACRELSEALDLRPGDPLLAALASRLASERRTEFETAFALVPDAPVSPGDSWDLRASRFLPPIERLHEGTRAVLQSVSAEGKATIRLRSRLSCTMARPLGDAIGDLVVVDGTGGRGEGTIAFDLAAGQLLESRRAIRIRLRSRLGGELAGFPIQVIHEDLVETRVLRRLD